MPIVDVLGTTWNSIRGIPDRIKKLISLTAADGAVFMTGDGNYTIVPFGSGADAIARGDHSHSAFSSLEITDGAIATNSTTGSLTLEGIGMGGGNIHSQGHMLAPRFVAPPDSFAGYHFWGEVNGIHSIRLQNALLQSSIPRLDTLSDFNMTFNISAGTNRGFIFANSFAPVAQIEGNGNIRNIGNIYCGGEIHTGNGATGSFNTGTKTITVVDGIITGID
ncbi:MAG: hypothetical protein AB4080_01905 [Trichodesmium sp.]